MRKFRKILLKILIINLFIYLLCIHTTYANVNKAEIEKEVKSYSENIDTNNIQKDDVLKIYDEVTSEYSSEEIADIIEENKEEIKNQGISEEVINTGANFIRTTDTEQLREIIQNDIDIDDIKEKIEKGNCYV